MSYFEEPFNPTEESILAEQDQLNEIAIKFPFLRGAASRAIQQLRDDPAAYFDTLADDARAWSDSVTEVLNDAVSETKEPAQ